MKFASGLMAFLSPGRAGALLASCLLFLAGCAELPTPPEAPGERLAPRVDEALKATPDGPVAVPDRLLSRGDVRAMWNQDRSALRACVATHGALVQELTVIEGGIPIERPAGPGRRKDGPAMRRAAP